MKYLYMILIGIVFINCSDKSVEVVNNQILTPTPIPTIESKEPAKVGAVEIVESANISDKTLVADERKVTKRIKSDVPTRCGMWSDGCNVCTRTSDSQASCTTYPACHNRMVSCLQWN